MFSYTNPLNIYNAISDSCDNLSIFGFQKGQMTTNEKSDPNALKIAVKDADKTKQMQGFGSEDDRPSSSKEISRQTKADHPKSGRSSAKSKSSQGSSKACVIL